MATLLTSEAKLRYMIQWFEEWTEMERNDFLHILIEECGPADVVQKLASKMKDLGNEIYDKPTLFRCRTKLFREWSSNWSREEKDKLLLTLKNADAVFAERYDEKISRIMRN